MTIRRITLFCTLLLTSVFLLHNQSTTASAANDAWTGHYFSNSQMQGAPVLTRSDPYLRFFWGNGKPAPEINSTDYFSARWSRTVTLDKAQRVIFTVRGDDGYRVFVDGKVLIDRLSGVPLERASAEMNLSAGSHVFYVEYYEHIGNASIDLQYYFGPSTQPTQQALLNHLGAFAEFGSQVTTIPTHDFFIRYGQLHEFPLPVQEITIDTVVYSWYMEFAPSSAPIGPNSSSLSDDGIELHDTQGNLVTRISWNPVSQFVSPTYKFFRTHDTLYVMRRAFSRVGGLSGSELRAYDVSNPWQPQEIGLPDTLTDIPLVDFVVHDNYGFALVYQADVPTIQIYNLVSATPHVLIGQVSVPAFQYNHLPKLVIENNHLFVTGNLLRYQVYVIAQ